MGAKRKQDETPDTNDGVVSAEALNVLAETIVGLSERLAAVEAELKKNTDKDHWAKRMRIGRTAKRMGYLLENGKPDTKRWEAWCEQHHHNPEYMVKGHPNHEHPTKRGGRISKKSTRKKGGTRELTQDELDEIEKLKAQTSLFDTKKR